MCLQSRKSFYSRCAHCLSVRHQKKRATLFFTRRFFFFSAFFAGGMVLFGVSTCARRGQIPSRGCRPVAPGSCEGFLCPYGFGHHLQISGEPSLCGSVPFILWVGTVIPKVVLNPKPLVLRVTQKVGQTNAVIKSFLQKFRCHFCFYRSNLDCKLGSFPNSFFLQ